MAKPTVLGLCASLRNARTRESAPELLGNLGQLKDVGALLAYLKAEGSLHLERYYKAGRGSEVSYDVLYANLRAMDNGSGLCNSEICLAAALWGAASTGAAIDYVPLAEHFREDGSVRDIDSLLERILAADGVVISTPVYFGDRSSLSQRLIELLRDEGLRPRLTGKVYGGAAVGAKRNGGQETTLIYQMHDMMDAGFLGVGNDFETTSQYGGTGHAGDIGAMPGDDYGLRTCLGVGRRVARVAAFMRASRECRLADRPKVGVWVLQEREREMTDLIAPLLERLADEAEVSVLRFDQASILPCMACDICPARIGPDEVFRCVRGKTDALMSLHRSMIEADVIMPAAYSPRDRRGLVSVYQQFIERTRYLRRGDYAFTDRLVVPMVLSDIDSNENLNVRMTTSLIRHHTVMSKPLIGHLHEGRLLNADAMVRSLADVVANGRAITAGRLAMLAQGAPVALYKPIGYVLSLAKDNLPSTMNEREKAIALRVERLSAEAERRLEESCAERAEKDSARA